VSAPVFAEVAQQILEYLGVPHDVDVREPKLPAKPAKPAHEDDQDNEPDINALFAAVNDLPADDPLRDPVPQIPAPQVQTVAEARPAAVQATATTAAPQLAANSIQVPLPPASHVVVNTDQLKVPTLVGLPVRKVIETAALAGLEVQVMGSGTVREQAPSAGSMVGPGTRIVVRCSR
jgi:cell division protein FtsI (penicillin-binding protein 3)